MNESDYPATLPCPQVAVVAPLERRALATSSRPREARALQRDRGILANVTWPPFTAAQAATFRAWWKDSIVFGVAPFNATWPLPEGLVPAIWQFAATPVWSFVPGGFWQVSAQLEVRGVGEVRDRDVEVVLLLHFQGEDGGTTFIDDSLSQHVFEAEAGATLDDASTLYGGTVGLFSGTGARIETPNSADFNFGDGDFTIEFWIRPPAAPPVSVLMGNAQVLTPVATGFYITLSGAGGCTLYVYADDDQLKSGGTGTLAADEWTHVAFSREGASVRVYAGGLRLAILGMESRGIIDSAGPLFIGSHPDLFLQQSIGARLAELRVIKGRAEYTGETYTVPTPPLPNP